MAVGCNPCLTIRGGVSGALPQRHIRGYLARIAPPQPSATPQRRPSLLHIAFVKAVPLKARKSLGNETDIPVKVSKDWLANDGFLMKDAVLLSKRLCPWWRLPTNRRHRPPRTRPSASIESPWKQGKPEPSRPRRTQRQHRSRPTCRSRRRELAPHGPEHAASPARPSGTGPTCKCPCR